MKISVIIPAYNAEKTIGKCLESLRCQTMPPLEILVIDDGSRDRTVEISRPYASVHSNIRKKGAGGARNTGGYAAQGDVLAFTDSDCVLPPDWLEKIARALEDDNTGAVAGGYTHHEGKSLIGRFACVELEERRKSFPDYIHTAVSNNLAVKRLSFIEAGGFPEIFNGATAEDMIFSFCISRKTKIKWLRDNGIGHHFPETTGSYLAQQYRFGRDAVVAYYSFPSLATVKTHHGYRIYLESFIAGCTLIALVRPFPWMLIGLLLIMVLNLPLLGRIVRSGDAALVLFTAAFLPLRAANLVRSVAGGIFETARIAIERRRKNSAPDR